MPRYSDDRSATCVQGSRNRCGESDRILSLSDDLHGLPVREKAAQAFGPVLDYRAFELGAGKQLQHLAENAGYSYHGGGGPCIRCQRGSNLSPSKPTREGVGRRDHAESNLAYRQSCGLPGRNPEPRCARSPPYMYATLPSGGRRIGADPIPSGSCVD